MIMLEFVDEGTMSVAMLWQFVRAARINYPAAGELWLYAVPSLALSDSVSMLYLFYPY